jgi:hypothetical protein
MLFDKEIITQAPEPALTARANSLAVSHGSCSLACAVGFLFDLITDA